MLSCQWKPFNLRVEPEEVVFCTLFMTVHQETAMHPVTGSLASLDFSHIGDPAAVFKISTARKMYFKTLTVAVKPLDFPTSLQVAFKLQENNGDDKRRRKYNHVIIIIRGHFWLTSLLHIDP
jgi:hypothetical protein